MWGCAPTLAVPERSVESDETALLPAPVGGVTSRSVRISTSASRPRLFAGGLSASKVASVRHGDVPAELADDEVPLLALQSEADAGGARLTPGAAGTWLTEDLLEAGREYTLVTPHDQVGFSTLASEVALRRRWPAAPATSRAVFCVDGPERHPLGAPGGKRNDTASVNIVFGGTLDAGAGAEWEELAGAPCFVWQARDGETFPVPPARVALQPTWRGNAAAPWPAGPSCTGEEVALEFGCLAASDDRVFIRAGETSTFWRVDGETPAWFVLEPQARGVIRGFTAGNHYELRAEVWAPDAEPFVQTFSVQTSAVSPHVVINEVMADPVGSEPAQEWVELYNDGEAPVSLEGWRLADGGGEINLPATSIAPMGYLLLVNDTYVPTAVGEPVPEANASIVRMPMLAKSGLSNTGEALRLLDKSDKVVSSFPGTPKPAPGVSVARVAPWLDDSDPSAFGRHATPGASPGADNHVRADAAGNE